MPLYRITAPNGQTYQIEGPDGASDAAVAQAVMAQYPESGQPVKKSTIGSELKRGAQQVASSMQTAYGALTGSPEEAARAGLERGDAISQIAGEGVGFEPVKRAYQEKGLLSAAGELASQVPRALAGQGANLAAMAGGARLGAMAGSAVAPGPGTLIGGALGAGAALLPQLFGSNVETQAAAQMERGEPVKIDRTKAGVAAAGQAALEGAGAAFTLGKGVVKSILGVTDDAAITSARAARQLEATAQRSLAASAGRGAAKGVVVEMPVEIAQQVIERAQAGQDLTSRDAFEAYGDAAYQAGLVGGPLGAAGNVVNRGQAKAQVAAKAEADAAAQAKRDAEIAAQPKLPLTAAPGTQGTLFTPEEMGKPVPAPKAPAEPAAAAVPEGQQDLGLDYQREYADMAKERERLKQQPQTPEVKARVAELSDQMALYTQSDIESIRAEAEGKVAREQEAADTAKRFPGLANAPDLITQSDEVKARTQSELFPGEDLGERVPTPAAQAEPTEPGAPTPVPPYVRKGEYQFKLPLRGGEVAEPFTLQNVLDTGIAPSTTRGWFEQNVVGKTQAEVQALVDANPALIDGPGKRAKILRELLAPQAAPFKETPRVQPTPPVTETPAVEQRDEPRASEPSVDVPSEPAAPIVPEPRARVPRAAKAPAAPDGRGLVPAGQPVVQGDDAQTEQPAAVTATKPKAPAKVAAEPAVETETADAEAARQAEADDIKRRLEALEKNKPAAPKPAPAPAPKAEPKAEKPAPTEIPDKLREPVGTTDFGGEDTVLRGPQGMLFPMSKREERDTIKNRKTETAEGAEDSPTKAQMVPRDSRQGKLDLNAAAEPASAPAEAAPKPAEAPAIAEWAVDYNSPGFTAVYGDDNIALFRAINKIGNQIYIGVSRARKGRYTNTEIESYTGADFTPEQRDTLLAARAKAVFEESKRAAKNPDGPFTGAATNVVKSDSVDQRYADLLQDLMRSMGLGDVRVFLVHPEDMRGPDAQAKYKLYKSYETAQTAGFGAGEEGSVQPMGPAKRDYRLSFKPGLSENKSIEVITHELGHMIQAISFNNAPADVQAAIKKEHEQWLLSTKGKTGRELVQLLRNRETADTQMLSVSEATTAEQMRPYWKSFSEWFADNTSRWASTSDKPVTITEKFFARVAQMMRDLVATVTGRKYPPNKKVAEFLDAMGPGSATLWLTGTDTVVQPSGRAEFSVSVGTESLVDSMGPLEREEKSGLTNLITGFKVQSDIGYGTKFRTQTADSAATIEYRLREKFDGAVRDKLGKLNPMGLYRQAQDYSKMLLEYFQVGAISKEPATGLWKVKADPKVRPPADVYKLIDKWSAKNGYSRERGTQIASRVLEGVRLDGMRASNNAGTTNFRLHLKDAEIDQLLREYNADPDLKAMGKLMDESRIAMVDNMVAVGRLTKEQGKEWREVVGYVPFDRLDDEKFDAVFVKAKKISNKGLAQLGKLPELIGSDVRPVGNVFDNYLNTLGWMVGQTMKTDATVQTLRSLEDAGHAKYLGRNTLGKDNVVGAYVDGEMMYWELPSKYDVLAFKDLNPPKAKWLQILGQASNVLRKAVTVLPPFALKQVTDDVQRAIMTSGVKNPGALLRMTLSNFGGLALAELRGIQHPTVKEFGALGLTGEYDFQQGKPAISLLKDLGYKPRGKFETLLHRLDGITRASDLAVRKAIYDQTMIENNNDQLLAQTRAREFINFRRRGASDFVGAMVTTIPFFNAYIQGMDVLYRAASGKDSSSSVGRAQARRMFYSRAAIAMTLSTLYALGKGDDDEDYNEMDLRTRDSNWILPGGFKIGVPTELGALFKVIPERIVEYMRRQGTPEEQTAWEATRTALAYIMEQYVGRVVPVPQGVKPLLEAWTNYSFFTGRELEGIYQKQQDPSLRRASNTSELAIAISEFSRDVVGVDKISPIMIDNALNGYFGSTAGLLVAMTDSLLNPTRVDRPLHKYALVSNYLYDPVGTRRKTEFYDEREKVGRANTTLRELMKTDLDRAATYAEEHADELMMESAVNSTLEQLENTRAYRKYLNGKEAAADMSQEEREDALKELKKMEVDMVSWVREAKVALRQ